jgi:hypothetical protein
MKLITTDTLDEAIALLAEAFIANKSVQWFLKDNKMSEPRLKAFCRYCIVMAMYDQGAYFSDDGNGVVLFNYHTGKKKSSLVRLLTTLRFVAFGCGIRRIPMIRRRQLALQQAREKEPHIYISLIASNLKGGNATIIELKQTVFDLSEKSGLPIFAETTLLLNLRVYQRYGFTCYDTHALEKSDVKIWMLRRAPKSRTPPTTTIANTVESANRK